MKTKLLTIVFLIFIGLGNAAAAEKTAKIEIKGNCSMCEKRIEKAASEVDGVSKADWDKTTKKLKVVYDESKTTTDKIDIAVASAGHDTPNHKAATEDYKGLPDCCKYRDNAKTH